MNACRGMPGLQQSTPRARDILPLPIRPIVRFSPSWTAAKQSVPMRIIVLPSSIAVSKSSDMPMTGVQGVTTGLKVEKQLPGSAIFQRNASASSPD